MGAIYVNDAKVAEGRVERTQPILFSLDDAADVGIDEGAPVTEEYTSAAGAAGPGVKAAASIAKIASGGTGG